MIVDGFFAWKAVAGDRGRASWTDARHVPGETFAPWIDPSVRDVPTILASASADGLVAFPVSRDVNNVRNDNGKLIEGVAVPANDVPKGKTLILF